MEKKVGGDKVDTNKLRGTNEKITDTAREQFENRTGYVMDYSLLMAGMC